MLVITQDLVLTEGLEEQLRERLPCVGRGSCRAQRLGGGEGEESRGKKRKEKNGELKETQ